MSNFGARDLRVRASARCGPCGAIAPQPYMLWLRSETGDYDSVCRACSMAVLTSAAERLLEIEQGAAPT